MKYLRYKYLIAFLLAAFSCVLAFIFVKGTLIAFMILGCGVSVLLTEGVFSYIEAKNLTKENFVVAQEKQREKVLQLYGLVESLLTDSYSILHQERQLSISETQARNEKLRKLAREYREKTAS